MPQWYCPEHSHTLESEQPPRCDIITSAFCPRCNRELYSPLELAVRHTVWGDTEYSHSGKCGSVVSVERCGETMQPRLEKKKM